jgi:transposase-like protein
MDIKTLRDLLRLESRLRDELVVKRLRDGETMQAVADDLGVTRQWVQQMAKRAGYHARAEKRAAKEAEQAVVTQ